MGVRKSLSIRGTVQGSVGVKIKEVETYGSCVCVREREGERESVGGWTVRPIDDKTIISDLEGPGQ